MRLRGQDLRSLLSLLAEHSDRGARLRQRSGSVAAVLLAVEGLLVALGYGRVALALLAAAGVAIVVVAAATVSRLGEMWAWLALRARRIAPAAAALLAAARGARRRCRRTWRPFRGAELARAGAGTVRRLPRPSAVRLERLLPALERRIGRAARRGWLTTPTARPPDSDAVANRAALNRNALGMQLRRAGEPAEAAEQHRSARALFAAAGNHRGEALAANNLALALADSGDDQAAMVAFEQARAMLRALGDTEHEAKVLANIGVIKQRSGAGDEAVELLQTALDKLEPETPAYRLVERQLRRPTGGARRPTAKMTHAGQAT